VQKQGQNMEFPNQLNNHLWGIAKWLRHWFLISIRKGSNPFTPRMNNYYDKLIKKTKLLNFWTFSGTELKSVFILNYKFIFCFYKKNLFFEYTQCVSVVKNIFPVLHSSINNKANILFVGTKYFYIQVFSSLKSKVVSQLIEGKIGTFTNFIIDGFKSFSSTKLKKNASLIFFLNVSINDFLLVESKKKNIPSIALINASNNSNLIDFPVFLNSFYFHNVYFFSRLVFKYILKLL
jgi:ribosomal protein S2